MAKLRNHFHLRNSLTLTFIRYFILFQIVIFLGLGIVIRFAANRMIYENQKENLLVMADSLEDTISMQFDDINELVYSYSKNPYFLDGLEDGDYYQVDILLGILKRQYANIDAVFLADSEGVVTASTQFYLLRTDISERNYFKAVVGENIEKYVSPMAIFSKATNSVVTVFASPIRSNGHVLGLLGVSLNLSTYGKSLLENKKIGETGYAFVTDKIDQVIIHPDPDLIMYDAGQWDFMEKAKALNKKVAFSPYTFKGASKLAAFARIEALDWMLVTTITEKEVASFGNRITLILVLAILISSILLVLFLFFLIRAKITRRLIPLEQLMEHASRGELSERGIDNGKDELASITVSYNTLIESLGAFFAGMHESLKRLFDNGYELSSNMEETAAAVEQIKANINSSMTQFQNQEESVNSTVSAVEEMTRNIESQNMGIDRQNESVVESSSAVEELIAQNQNIAASTEEAEQCMEGLVESSQIGYTNIKNVANLVSAISDKSHELEAANGLISGIAARTNLLAMNAAIEAAHAGDAGKGFAVVADEIRKLAEQSTTQSKQVKNSISEIKQSIKNVVEGSRISGQSYEDIQKNIDLMGRITREIRSSMDEQSSGGSMILNSLQDMRDIAGGVKDGSREMTQGNHVILDAVGNLRDVNYQLNQAMEEIRGGIDEINNSVLKVSELTDQNRESLEKVREEASQYKL